MIICLLFAIPDMACNHKVCKKSKREIQTQQNSGIPQDPHPVKESLTSSPFFSLLEAWHEAWTAGIASGHNSLEYFFKIKIETDKKMTFDSAWIGKKSFPVFISKAAPVASGKPVEFGKGDTIIVRVSDIQDGQQEKKEITSPVSHSGDALIRYKVEGKIYYFSIAKMGIQQTPNATKK